MNEIKFILNGNICSPLGFKASGISAEIKKSKKLDMGLIFSERDCVTVGTFTTNKFAAAPVKICKEKLSQGNFFNAIIVNSGNANACTGNTGIKNSNEIANKTAQLLNICPKKVLVASTGIIGEQLPMIKINNGIEQAVSQLSQKNGLNAAQAIMTTDTKPKYAAVNFKLHDKIVTIGGMIKGAGMIAPKMKVLHATLLAFITTDANISKEALDYYFAKAIDHTLNRITIDGDMSTNDSAFIMANGESNSMLISNINSDEGKLFYKALQSLLSFLAKETVKDGEGVTKFITVNVKNAKSKNDAEKCCKAIAESLLCKTAWFGNDPNWGRIIAAIGYSEIDFNPETIEVYIDDYPIVLNGMGVQEELSKIITTVKRPNFSITIDLKSGESDYYIWTNVISYKYIEINAEYHT